MQSPSRYQVIGRSSIRDRVDQKASRLTMKDWMKADAFEYFRGLELGVLIFDDLNVESRC